MTKHLTPDDCLSVISMYQAGEKVAFIAVEFGIHESTVTNIIKRHGVPIRWYRNGGRMAAMRAAE